jgi:hypothetical protein
MGRKANAAKRPKGPLLQQILDRETIEAATAPLVNRFAEQHGDYGRNLRFVTNRGGTAIDRWRRDGNLSDSQVAGILHCQNLWSKLGSQSVVVDFDRVRGQPSGIGYSQHEALAEVHRISSSFPHDYWDVFENVCRHDLPAGVAGSRLANTKRSAETAARLIVCFIADLISMRERLSY